MGCYRNYESHIVVGVTRQTEYLGQAVLIVDHGRYKADAENYIEEWRDVKYAKTKIFESYGAHCVIDPQLSWPTSGRVTIDGQSVFRKLTMAWEAGYTLEYWAIFGWLGLDCVGLIIAAISCRRCYMMTTETRCLHFAAWVGTMLPLLLLVIRTDPTISHQGKSGLLIALLVVTALGWLPIICVKTGFVKIPKDPSTAIAIEMKPQAVTDGVKVTEVIVTEG